MVTDRQSVSVDISVIVGLLMNFGPCRRLQAAPVATVFEAGGFTHVASFHYVSE